MTHKKDEALKLALEALETAYAQTCSVGRAKDWQQLREAITAIKQALAAQPVPVQEPITWLKTIETLGGFGKFVEAKPNEKGAKPVYLTPPAAQPAPVAQREAIKELVDQYARECVEFSRAIAEGAHSMSPIAVKSGDTRLELHTAIDAITIQPAVQLTISTPPAAPVQPDAWQALRDKVQADIDRPEGRWGMHGRRPKDAVDDDYFAALIWMVGQMDAILIHAAPEKGQP